MAAVSMAKDDCKKTPCYIKECLQQFRLCRKLPSPILTIWVINNPSTPARKKIQKKYQARLAGEQLASHKVKVHLARDTCYHWFAEPSSGVNNCPTISI